MSTARPQPRAERRIVVGALVLGLVLLGNALFAISGIGALRDQDRGVLQSHRVIASLQNIEAAMTGAETAQRGFLLTGDSSYLEPFGRATGRIATELEEVTGLAVAFPELGDHVGVLDALVSATLADLQRSIDRRNADGFEAARLIVLTHRGTQPMDSLRVVLSRMEATQTRHLEERSGASDRSFSRLLGALTMSTLIGIALVVVGAVAIVGHLARRAQVEDSRWASEQRYRLTFDQAPVGMAHVATDGRWLMVNDRLCAMLGYERDQLLARSFQDVTHVADLPADLASVERMLAGESATYTMEKRYVHRSGALVWALLTVSLVRDQDGMPAYFISAVDDISELKSLQEKLELASRQRNDFLAMLAHELRNPLAPILSAVEILRTLSPHEPRIAWARDVIERQAQQISHLVTDLLDISRITQGKLTLQKEEVALDDVVQQAVEMAQPHVAARGQRLEVEVVPPGGRLVADAARLAQVTSNLLSNASKFSSDGTRIGLRAAVTESEVVLRVTDSGVGIPQDFLPFVFDLFSQADYAVNRDQSGLGIGLSLVKRIVTLHGGTVEAASDGPGRGSEFVVRLPVTPDLSAVPAGADATTAAAPPQRQP